MAVHGTHVYTVDKHKYVNFGRKLYDAAVDKMSIWKCTCVSDASGADSQLHGHRTRPPNMCDTSDGPRRAEWWICWSRVGSRRGRPVVVPILPGNDRERG